MAKKPTLEVEAINQTTMGSLEKWQVRARVYYSQGSFELVGNYSRSDYKEADQALGAFYRDIADDFHEIDKQLKAKVDS